MSDADISPLYNGRRGRKRKRELYSPLSPISDTENVLFNYNQSPRKRVKTHKPSCVEIDLCSESENDSIQSRLQNSDSSQSKTNAKKKKKESKKAKNDKNKKKKETCFDCPICSMSLRELSPTRQQLHINSCLDLKEKEKDYTYSMTYECNVCHTDLTAFDESTRAKHMNACLIDAQKNADDMEYEEDPLASLDEERMRKKEMMKNVIVTTELKSIFERKFVCFMCDKNLNRFKLKGRCNHLKKCAKQSGKDVYSVCALVGIQRDIIDNPKKYEKKFDEHYNKGKKKKKNKKDQQNDVGIELNDFDAFKFDGSPSKHQILVNNDGSKTRMRSIGNELDGLMKRRQKKKRIAINNYDEYIQDTINDLAQIGSMTQKLNELRQHLEVKLQRARALKKQHEEKVRAEQESILQSVSPSKPATQHDNGNGFLNFSNVPLSNENHCSQRAMSNAIQFKESSVGANNKDLLASQRIQKIMKKRNIWDFAQDAHKSSPSQFNLSNVLPKCKDSIIESPTKSQRSFSTQLLLDELDNEEMDNKNNHIEDNLMTSFFNEANSCVPYAGNEKMNVCSSDDENPILSRQNSSFLSQPQCNDEMTFSLSESALKQHNGNGSLNDNSLHSNNGSLFEVEIDRMDEDNVRIETFDILTNVDDNNGNSNNNVSMTMSPMQNFGQQDDISHFGDSQNEITPISNNRKNKICVTSKHRMCLPETPMHKVPITPMIGVEKEKVLKALNLYFETPQQERSKYEQPTSLPPDIEGRQEYIDKINAMSVDELKKEMKQFGFKCGSKKMMLQRLEMAFDALHPNSPMYRALDEHTQRENSNDDDSDNKKKNEKPIKKTQIQIEEDIIKLIASNDELWLRIATLSPIKFEEFQKLCKTNNIKIGNKNLQNLLDDQGICFVLPEPAKKNNGPRRCGAKRKRRK